jgi:hypothetical protein
MVNRVICCFERRFENETRDARLLQHCFENSRQDSGEFLAVVNHHYYICLICSIRAYMHTWKFSVP